VGLIRAGIVGYGLAGEVFHGPLVAATDGMEVAGVVTRDPGRAAAAAAAHPAARVVGSFDELLGLGLDLVVVATPNRFHAPIAEQALARDVAVVVDKPFAVTPDEAERVLAAGGRVTVFQNRRWDGDFLTARRLVEEGALGPVVRFESRFERFRPAPKQGWRELADAAEGGGQLLDLGSHLVDQAIVLFGPPVAVYAEIDVRRPGAAVDDDVFVALEHAGGARSHLWAGSVAPLHGPRLAVSGLTAGFAVDGLDPQEPQLRDGLRPGDPGYGERDRPGRFADADGERPIAVDPGDYRAFYAGVRDWLNGDAADPPVDPRESLAGLRVLEAAVRSAAERRVVAPG
jgi:predicted dehydrogenase